VNSGRTLSVVIASFNEARFLPVLVERLQVIANDVKCFIFVDDGSTDSSSKIIQEKLENADLSYQIVEKENGGKASAVQAGISKVLTSHVAILDADLELDPLEIPKLWEPIKNGEAEAVYGYREFRAHSSYTFRYSYGNKFLSNFYGVLFNEVISDIMCGYKLVPVEVFTSRVVKSSNFGIELDLTVALWLARVKPIEIAVSYKARGKSEGKVIGVRDALQIALRMIWLRVFKVRQSQRGN